MLKASCDVLRIFFRRKCLNLESLGMVLAYGDRACSENRKMLYKYLDMESIRFEYSDNNFILSHFAEIKPPELYE